MPQAVGTLPNEALLVLGSWVFWIPVFAGVGALGWKRPGADGWMLRFWTGWSSVLLFLQLWHFALPVDARAVAVVAVFGLAGLLRAMRELRGLASLPLRSWLVAAVVVATALWLSQLALGGVRNGDSGLYHQPVMHWSAEHAVVPGLGNLHVRFASNQSALLYAALCDAGPAPGIGSHTMNGLLILVLLAACVSGLFRVLSGASRHLRSDAYLALFLVPTASLALTLNLTSPSPDVAVFVCGAALMAMLLRFFEEEPSERSRGDLVALAVVAVAGVTIKLSLAFLSGLALAVAAGGWLLRARPRRRETLGAVGLLALVVAAGFGAWVARNVVLSGTLVYPVPSTGLALAWAVPREIIATERNYIGTWKGGLSLAALGNWNWLETSLRSFGWERWDVLGPLVLAAFSLAGLALRFPWRRGGGRFPHGWLLLPTLAALASWFLVAPLPRFAGAALWSLAIQLLLWAFDGIAPRVLPRVLVLASSAGLVLLPWLQGEPALSGLRGFEPESPPRLEARTMPGGLEVLVPAYDACKRAPLLCTPTPIPGLRLRRPGDLAAGFVIDPALAASSGDDAAEAGR
jgi:hypothetical protein